MVILGIDPGYAIVGYGGIEYYNGKFHMMGYGAITTTAGTDFNHRLEIIYDSLEIIMNKLKPDCMAIEKLYFQNNQKTAIQVAEARGITLLAAQKHHIPIYEYTPLQVKTAVTGFGQAPKIQVMKMTQRLLKLNEIPKPDDAADALAIAICHTQNNSLIFNK